MKKPFRFKKAGIESSKTNRTLIILSNPRSGSTWLFDAIRCHPAVEMLVRGDVYRDLDLEGRRYPRDLVPSNRNHLNVEVRPDLDKWAKVPLFSLPADDYNIPGEILEKKFAVEKIHPHFYRFDIDSFLSRVDTYTDKNRILEMIYLVRDPKASLVSFYNYQKRNPKWNSGKTPVDVIKHMNLIYQSILEIAKRRKGLIVDYGQLRMDFEATLSAVYDFLWPGTADMDSDRKLIIEKSSIETAWEKRKSKRPFLGKQIGSESGDKSEYDSLFEEFTDEITQCYSSYETLHSLDKG